MKVCSHCHLPKNDQDFPARGKVCKKCKAAYVTKWQKQNRDKVLEYKQKHNRSERGKQQKRDWYHRHAETEKPKARIRIKSKKFQEYKKTYNKTHPEKARIAQHNRRALMRGTFSEREWKILLELCGYKCLRCNRTDVELTQDHIKPLSRGGSNTIDNIQPLCETCNKSKFTQTIDYRPLHLRWVNIAAQTGGVHQNERVPQARQLNMGQSL